MKIQLTKEEYDKLSDDLKKEYSASGDGFSLKLEDEDGSDMSSLKSAKDHEKKRRQEAEKKLKDLEAEKETLEDKVHDLETNAPDLKKEKDQLEASYKAKADREIAKIQKEVDKRDTAIQKHFVEAKANEIAGRISTVPAAMARLIKDRLSIDWDGDELKTVVLGADGKPTEQLVAELEKEFISNKDFSGIIKGGQASGSGATPGTGPGSGAFSLADYQNDDKSVNWGKVAEASKADPELIGKVKEAIN